MRENYRNLQERILAYLRSPDDEFNDLAVNLFQFQRSHNPPYRAFCESIGHGSDDLDSWTEIPPAPPQAFKAGLPLSCLPPAECEREFLTSGTTQDVQGHHWMGDLRLYRESVTRGWNRLPLPEMDYWFLARDPSQVPHSSLGCMFETLSAGQLKTRWLLQEDGSISMPPLRDRCEDERPFILFATALALRHLLEIDPAPLPPGSWIFQTGGYKGLSEEYDPKLFYRALDQQLGIPANRVINEYGMTELSSQAYALGLIEPHRTPPWLKVRTIDPETNQPNPGETGHLVFYDLANLNSVLAIRTHDLGITIDEHTFRLCGRDPSAELRGCSRASDSFLQS